MSGEKINPREFADFREAFDLFDVNNEGVLNIKDLKNNLITLNYPSESPELWKVIDSLDTPENVINGVDFNTFCIAFKNAYGNTEEKQTYEKLYDLFINKSGNEPLNDVSVKKLAEYLNLKMDLSEARLLIERASKNGRDLSFEEFHEIMQKTNYKK